MLNENKSKYKRHLIGSSIFQLFICTNDYYSSTLDLDPEWEYILFGKAKMRYFYSKEKLSKIKEDVFNKRSGTKDVKVREIKLPQFILYLFRKGIDLNWTKTEQVISFC